MRELVDRGFRQSWKVIFQVTLEGNFLLFVLLAEVEKWEDHWAINIRGPLLCYKYAARQMVKQGSGGRIVGRNPWFNVINNLH